MVYQVLQGLLALGGLKGASPTIVGRLDILLGCFVFGRSRFLRFLLSRLRLIQGDGCAGLGLYKAATRNYISGKKKLCLEHIVPHLSTNSYVTSAFGKNAIATP